MTGTRAGRLAGEEAAVGRHGEQPSAVLGDRAVGGRQLVLDRSDHRVQDGGVQVDVVGGARRPGTGRDRGGLRFEPADHQTAPCRSTAASDTPASSHSRGAARGPTGASGQTAIASQRRRT